MARPVTLFTGQWADLPLEELAAKAAGWGFDGLELACWGDHFEVDRALAEPGYVAGQARAARAPRARLLGARRPPGRPGGVRPDRQPPPGRAAARGVGRRRPRGGAQRAAARMQDTARAAAAFGVTQVNGFTGSPIWHMLYSFPPNDFAEIDRGYSDFAERWNPIIDVFEREGVRFGLEVHPTEIAYDFVDHAPHARGDRAPRGLRHQLRPQPLRPPVPRFRRVRRGVRRPHLPRPRQGLAQDARRAPVDPRRPPELRRAGARLGLRLARPRRRRLRVAAARAEPHRLRRAAVDRVGGCRHGPRVGRAGRAGVRAPQRLRALVVRVRRGDAEEWPMSEPQVGFVTQAPAAGRRRGGRDRRRHARLRVHGQGALERLPDAPVHDLAAAAAARAGRDRRTQRARRSPRPPAATASATHVTDWRRAGGRRPGCAVRQRRPQQPARRADDRRRRGGQARAVREAAGAHRGRELRDLAAPRRGRRQAHVRVQLPLRARGPAGARDDRGRRARRDLPLPRPLPAGVDHRPRDALAARRGRGRLGRARRPRRARHRPRALPGRRDQRRCRR